MEKELRGRVPHFSHSFHINTKETRETLLGIFRVPFVVILEGDA